MKYILFFLALAQVSIAQLPDIKSYNEGDIVNIKATVKDTSDSEKTINIPNGEYTLLYKGSRDNRRNSYEFTYSKDSMKLLESIIPLILKQYGIKKLKIIYLDSKVGSSYYYWLQTFKKEIVIKPSKDYQVDYYVNNTKDLTNSLYKLEAKLSLIDADGKLLSFSNYINGLGKPQLITKTKSIKAKLLTESNGVKRPLINVLVYLMEGNSEDEALSETKTDKYGDFQINMPNNSADYKIKTVPDMQVTNVILATQEGKEISKFTKSSFGFDYKLLDVDIVRLTQNEEQDDISFRFKQFKATESEIKITENISYANASFTLDNNSKSILDKVVIILKENPKIKIEIISHTDSQGDDKSNLILSEKRSISVLEYFVSKGIDKTRLKGTGRGETEIRNRCTNSIDCSDIEHQYNRRTEFRFTKN